MTQPYSRPPYHHQDLPIPYDHCDRDRELSRLSADIPYEDKNLIRGICPKQGILNQLTQNIFASICKNLRKHGITYYAPDHERYFIQLILRGCTAIELAEPAPFGHVHGGITCACATAKGGQLECCDPQEVDHQRESRVETSEQSESGLGGAVEQISNERTMKRNYIIAKYWNENNTRLCVYSFGTEVHFGTEAEAQELLRFVKEQSSDNDKYQILWINTENIQL